MKRRKNIYQEVYNMDNLILAEKKAMKGKSTQDGVIKYLNNPDENLPLLQEMLMNKTYRTSPYYLFTIREPKERQISRLPFFPDRIAQHAAMNILEDMFVSTFTADTYSCIKGRGIHGALSAVKSALKDVPGTKYCLKLDIKKFYPSIDHDILKSLLRRKIKDKNMLCFLDEIIDSAEGLPIGNYLSQYLANFYLAYFDHWIKEVLGVKYYLRYADDMVLFGATKEELHQILAKIREYLTNELKLTIKGNYRIFPIWLGLDFVGYKCYPNRTLLRPSIKRRFARMVAKRRNRLSISSYYGWAKHADCKRLLKKLKVDEEFRGFQYKACG